MELDLFRRASNWKAYYGSFIKAYLKADVLEVGAGIGATTKALCEAGERRWICLEPDPALSAQIDSLIRSGGVPPCCETRVGTLADLSPGESFDAVIYIDVLEHIEDDAAEVRLAAERLRGGGVLVVLSPAHQWLYTPFDRAIGHHRRYNKRDLSAIMPGRLSCVKLIYLDSVGALASAGNKLLLKSSMPTPRQIIFWDRVMIPLSRAIDPLLNYSFGRSILGIWEKV